MKQRDYNNSRRRYDKYSKEGFTNVELQGYVQRIKEDKTHQCDYVTFYIIDENDPDKKGKKDAPYEIIGVTIPWELGAVEEGDHIHLWGIIKSWSTDYGVKLEVRAQIVEEINDTAKELSD